MTKRELESEQELDPSKDADKIIQEGKWKPYANRIITSGKWKSYFSNGKIIAYTFREAAAIEEHQKNVDEERLGNLHDMFKPLPPLRWKEKEENKRLYWTRIRTLYECDDDADVAYPECPIDNTIIKRLNKSTL